MASRNFKSHAQPYIFLKIFFNYVACYLPLDLHPTMPTIRTTAHSYPQEEVTAMTRFYHGKRCVVTLVDVAQWAHILDAAPSSSTSEVFSLPSLHDVLT